MTKIPSNGGRTKLEPPTYIGARQKLPSGLFPLRV